MSKRSYTGKIVSTKMNKTVVVAVEMPKRHKLYSKVIKSTKRFLTHDAFGLKLGDLVQIEESRPFSKNTSWTVVKKLEEAKA